MTELDVEVAKKVMGLTVEDDPADHRGVALKAGYNGNGLPYYSRDLDQAMKVLDRMRDLGHRWLMNIDDAGFHLRHVICVHQNDIEGEKEYTCDRPLGTAKKLEDLPKVICEAALKETEALALKRCER